MICILLSIIATVVGSFATGFIWLFFLMVEPVAIFIYTQIPIAKLATVETFLEMGLLINLLLIKMFGQRRRTRNIVSLIGLVIIFALVIPALHLSFSNPFSFLTNDIPIYGDLYRTILKFFINITNHIKEFFIG